MTSQLIKQQISKINYFYAGFEVLIVVSTEYCLLDCDAFSPVQVY
jgi:hypothetical protein